MVDNPEKAKITDAMVGHWVEISGRLESETSKNPDNLRELDVMSAKLIPVVAPPTPGPAATPAPARRPAPAPAAESRPSPAPAPAAAAAPAPAPAPEAPKKLPKTASPLPAIGLAGLLSFAGSLVLRSFRLRRRG
jgi:hypothetical protein